MGKTKVILSALVVFMLMAVAPIKADTYKVLYANSENIKIGNQPAKKGVTFNDKDRIIWTSGEQALKVLNLSTNHVMVIAKRAFDRQRARSLADYLHRVKHMSTRDFGTASVVTDTVYYMLDTLLIDAGKHYGDDKIDKAIVIINGDSVVTQIKKTQDKKEFVLTKSIFGSKTPQLVYIDIVETDVKREWVYYVYRRLRIESLPMRTD